MLIKLLLASAHYMICRDGEIYKLVSTDRVAYHAGKGTLQHFPEYEDCLNESSIGIELLAIGTEDEMASMINAQTYDSLPTSFLGYTKEQYESLDSLIDYLIEQNPDVIKDRKHIIGHDEYAPNRKTDPGILFDWHEIGLTN